MDWVDHGDLLTLGFKNDQKLWIRAIIRFFGVGKFTQKIAKHHHLQSKSKSYLALCSDPHELLGYGFDAVAQFRCAKV